MLDYIAVVLLYLVLIGVIALFFKGAYKVNRYDKYDYYEEGDNENENF